MKKKLVIFLIAIIILIIGAIFVIYKINENKVNYEISKIQDYKYFKYNENEKMGVIDKNGNIVINAQYDDIIIPDLEKDIFICYNRNVDKNNILNSKIDDIFTQKVLNSKNEELFTQYDNIQPIKLKYVASILCYEKSVLIYEKDGLYGLIDFNGKEITKNIYNQIENLESTEGKFRVQKDGKYGVINLNGMQLVDCNYDYISTDGYYNVENEYKKSGFIVSNKTENGIRYGYINFKGEKLLDANYNEITRIENLDEIYLIVAENGQYGLYKNSKQIIKPQYQGIEYFENGVLIIQKNQNVGIASLEGKVLVEPKYDTIDENGIYLYAENSNESKVYDTSGKEVSINYNKMVYKTDDEKYRIVTLLNNDKTYYGIEDASGKTLVNTGYLYLEYLYNGYFIARGENEKYGVIDSNGKKYIDFEYDIIQKIKNKNMVQLLSLETKTSYIYSSELKKICELQNATIDVLDEYVKIYNNEKNIYIDNNGNIIPEDSDVIKNTKNPVLPSKIGDYEKVQYSLEDAYYMKK